MDSKDTTFQGYNDINAFKNALTQFDKAARLLHITENQIAMIKESRLSCKFAGSYG